MKTDQSGYGSVAFEWKDTHNVWIFDDKAAFDVCDFNHTMLLPLQSGYIFTSNAGTYYFGCFVYGHCTSGQKLQLVIEEGRYGDKQVLCHVHMFMRRQCADVLSMYAYMCVLACM